MRGSGIRGKIEKGLLVENVAYFFLMDVGPESVPFPVLVQYHARSEGNTRKRDLGLHDLSSGSSDAWGV
jgi:hypothetical protein